MNLDDILSESHVGAALAGSDDVTKQQIQAFVLAEMSQALNDSQYLPEFVTKLTERVKSW